MKGQQYKDKLKWEDVRDSVDSIVFGTWGTFNDTVDIYIDEIILNGVYIDDLKTEK